MGPTGAKKRGRAGEANAACVLADAQVEKIRSEWLNGVSQTALASRFGVSLSQVCRITRGQARGGVSLKDAAPPEGYIELANWPGYCVNRSGDVLSRRTNGGLHPTCWRRIKQGKTRDGYSQVHLCNRGRSKQVRVHSLVLLAFVGPKPEGMQACHGNGNRRDNRVENLRWGTPQSNIDDRERHGRTARGEKNGNAKVTDQQMLEICRLRSEGLPLRRIGSLFGISHRQVGRILDGLRRIDAPREVEILRGELLPAAPSAVDHDADTVDIAVPNPPEHGGEG